MNTQIRFKVNELHLRAIRMMLNIADVMTEHKVCIKYGVAEIEDLYATDYDDIVEEIQKGIASRPK